MRVLLCSCTNRGDAVNPETVKSVVAGLTESCCQVVMHPDLCALLERRDPDELAGVIRDVDGIAACHPRAIVWMLRAMGMELPLDFPVLDLKACPVATSSSVVGDWLSSIPDSAQEGSSESVSAVMRENEADGWFPVIDYERCSSCGQCFQFCMFGVYEQDGNGKVLVSHPEKCKLNCPACARLCPENAIIFPKSPDSAINGAELSEAERDDAQDRLALHAKLMQGDVYSMLQSRKRGRRGDRKSILRPDALGTDLPPIVGEKSGEGEPGS